MLPSDIPNNGWIELKRKYWIVYCKARQTTANTIAIFYP